MALPRSPGPPDSRSCAAIGKVISSTCGLMLVHFRLQMRDLDLVVEVTDVADDGAVLHRAHVLDGDDVLVAGGGDEDIMRGGVFWRDSIA